MPTAVPGHFRYSLHNQPLLAVLLIVLMAAPSPVESRNPGKGRTQFTSRFNLVSYQQEVELGRVYARILEAHFPVMEDSAVNSYLNELGTLLVDRAPGPRFPYTFTIINANTLNACAFPGGPIYVNRGILEGVENEAQLAAAVAHMIAHVALRHATRYLSMVHIANSASLPFVIESRGSSTTNTSRGLDFGLQLAFLSFQRRMEWEADLLAVQILHDMGYDTREMVIFLEALSSTIPHTVPQVFSKHPSREKRKELISKEIDKLGGVRGDARKDSEAFRLIRAWIQRMPSPPGPGEFVPAMKETESCDLSGLQIPSPALLLGTFGGANLGFCLRASYSPYIVEPYKQILKSASEKN